MPVVVVSAAGVGGYPCPRDDACRAYPACSSKGHDGDHGGRSRGLASMA